MNRRFLAFAVVVAGIGLWEAGVRLFHVPIYIMPPPSAVAQTLFEKRAYFLAEMIPTSIETIAGFVLGNGFGIAVAILLLYMRSIDGAVMSLAITLRGIPLVALAPLLVLILGDGYAPRIVVVAIICFFPTLVNMHLGLLSVDRPAAALFRSLSATNWQTLTKLQLPSSLPALFAALKVAASSAVLGAIIAEWVNSNQGLGFVVIQSTYQSQARELYAAIVLSSLLSVLFYLAIGALERFVVTWKATNAAT